MRSLFLILFLIPFSNSLLSFDVKNVSEKDKILFLIASIRTASDCQFIRNGSVYSPKEAANHMELKWKKHQDKIRTVIDFIEIVGTKSNITQQPYLVKFSDGKTQELAIYLRMKLKTKYG
jgi:hypothetical protein